MGLLTRAILSHPEYHPSFFFCCRATMGISREAGSSFCAVVHARIKAEGTMMVLRRRTLRRRRISRRDFGGLGGFTDVVLPLESTQWVFSSKKSARSSDTSSLLTLSWRRPARSAISRQLIADRPPDDDGGTRVVLPAIADAR